MIVRIDARKLKDSASLHAALNDGFGFAAGSGKNLDALVDCLTHLDDARSGLSRVQVFPGQVALLVLEHVGETGTAEAAQVKSLTDVVAFVNWRRLEKGQPPVLALAYEPK